MPRELRPGDEPPLDEEFPRLEVLSRSPLDPTSTGC